LVEFRQTVLKVSKKIKKSQIKNWPTGGTTMGKQVKKSAGVDIPRH
jgi:hypothetical protein